MSCSCDKLNTGRFFTHATDATMSRVEPSERRSDAPSTPGMVGRAARTNVRLGCQSEPSERESIEEPVRPAPPRHTASLASPIDDTLIAPLRDLGPDDLRELIRMFLDEAKGRVARLRVLRQQGDAPELAKVAHTLRGTSAAFGATRLTALCAEIEATRDTGEGVRLSTLIDAVAMEFERVQTALTEELS